MPITYTPLRYPGGKSSLYPAVSKIIKDNDLEGCVYVEPFAGGAGLAIKLLLLNEVSSIVLNDLDPAIASIWLSILNQKEEIVDFINAVAVTLSEWDKQRGVYASLRKKALSGYEDGLVSGCNKCPLDYLSEEESFQLACASLFLNRTNRSGIMAGGPIGGRSQNGKWGIDARFNKTNLVEKIESIFERRSDISVFNLDAAVFVKNELNVLADSEDKVFVYFDPPYVEKGPGLYKNSLNKEDHESLANQIASCNVNWMVTYDECALTKELYKDFSPQEITIGYCAYKASRGKEILVLSEGLNYEGERKQIA